MRRRRIAAVTGAAALLGVVGAPWSGSPALAVDHRYVTAPGSLLAGFTPPVLVINAGDTVTYTNADPLGRHDVVATVFGPDTPKCAEWRIPAGECPLFWTLTIGVGSSAPVWGLENVKPGDQIPFICTLHGNMDGTLVVLPEA